MTKTKLVKYLKAGYAPFKAESGLPVWMLPEHSFSAVVEHFGDQGIMALTQPLDLSEDFEKRLEELPAPETLPDEIWHSAIRKWPSLDQVCMILHTMLEVTSLLTEKFRQNRLQAEPEKVVRALAVMGLASLIPRGSCLVGDLALILRDEPNHPAELIRLYAQAVIENDLATLRRVSECIARYQVWTEWAELFILAAGQYPETPRLVGITPPLSNELVEILVEMLQEEHDAKSGRDHR